MTYRGTPLAHHQAIRLAADAGVGLKAVIRFAQGTLTAGSTYDRVRAAFETRGLPTTKAVPRKRPLPREARR